MCQVHGARCLVRNTKCEVRGRRYEMQSTWYVVHLLDLRSPSKIEIMYLIWELVGSEPPCQKGSWWGLHNSLCFEFTQKWNELCFVNILTLTLYSSQAGQSPPGEVGCQGLDTPCTANISQANSSQIWCLCPFWLPSMCMWYMVHSMRYEVQGMRYVVQGTTNVVLGSMRCKRLLRFYGGVSSIIRYHSCFRPNNWQIFYSTAFSLTGRDRQKWQYTMRHGTTEFLFASKLMSAERLGGQLMCLVRRLTYPPAKMYIWFSNSRLDGPLACQAHRLAQPHAKMYIRFSNSRMLAPLRATPTGWLNPMLKCTYDFQIVGCWPPCAPRPHAGSSPS